MKHTVFTINVFLLFIFLLIAVLLTGLLCLCCMDGSCRWNSNVLRNVHLIALIVTNTSVVFHHVLFNVFRKLPHIAIIIPAKGVVVVVHKQETKRVIQPVPVEECHT